MKPLARACRYRALGAALCRKPGSMLRSMQGSILVSIPRSIPVSIAASTTVLPTALLMALLTVSLLMTGCGDLLPKPAAMAATYTLAAEAPTQLRGAPQAAARAPTLMVSAPRAAPGFDSRHMVYMREKHRLEHFARNEWVDTPARMLAPLIVAALVPGAAFSAVLTAPSPAMGDLQLDTDSLRLHQDFSSVPSRVRFALRATLTDSRTRRVLAWRDFEQVVPALADTPEGGVEAANRAVQLALVQMAAFCGQAAQGWQPP